MFNPHEYDGAPIEEPATFKTFFMFVHKPKRKAGGCDGEWNNCLYHCLHDVYPEQVAEHFGKPSRLKKYLDLGVKEMIPIELIPSIEDKINVGINDKSDHCYISTNDAAREVNLILTNGHYTLDNDGSYVVKGVAIKTKDRQMQPVAFKQIKDNRAQIYDGSDYSTMSLDEFIKEKSTLRYKSMYQFNRIVAGQTLKQTLAAFINDADALIEGTERVIDMYFTGQNINKAVRADHIEQDEGEWISKAGQGALMFAIQHTGPLHKYDVCNMYASIMRSKSFMVPIKRGTFQQMTELTLSSMPSIPFGIYRAIINGTHRAFKTNNNNYYTHYDLMFAKELGLTFNLKTDDKHNALIYDSKCRINGSILFGKYIDQVLGWKDASEPKSRLEQLCKCLYQRLWGALAKRNKTKQCVSMECDEEVTETNDGQRTIKHFDINVDTNYTIDRITPTAKGQAMVKSVSNTDMFDTPFARIMPFIISHGRKMIGTIIKDNIDHIKRVHTDGFCTTKEWKPAALKASLDYPKLGTECGDLRYEGFCASSREQHVQGSWRV
ncbi:hypothetical protein SAMD00019534_082070 [Acytostelium subglobosum LB1]|uniref:hypothetical protein n=1 Tax=Acytostelium subglobosum LB1 TaxID=1410327 RepID=UPI00064484FF|nr:hypothetical protein SAMD00019534_082070 [Acytostelium subglobosum LB1]GAM25032.1 hypothetical protein SAMD00019534_082070 [Acytostelium subglobosum LB1]|eukprot:XP_012752121.1 hypothetical protein SAMD00019534_082070 [Acytostelium subglobosum LB1]